MDPTDAVWHCARGCIFLLELNGNFLAEGVFLMVSEISKVSV